MKHLLLVAFLAFVGTVMARSPNPPSGAAAQVDEVVPETELTLSQAEPKGPQAGKWCSKIWAKQDTEKYAAKCVRYEYKEIPCPVLRGLMGSGLLEWLPGTVTPRKGLLKVLKDVLGASDAILPVFAGAVHGTTDNFDNVRLLDLVELKAGHAASSGIIGAATSGTGKDHAAFNKDQFKKLTNLAKKGEYNAERWGKAVNMFAAERFLTSKLEPESDLTDMAWEMNPFSWTFLALEYANVFSAFKNANIKGKHSCAHCISESTVKALWQEAKLPKGFKPAKGEMRLDFSVSHALIKDMKVTMFPKVTKDMHALVTKDPATWAPIKGLVETFCGGDFKDCDWNWPKDGPSQIPGVTKFQQEFGYNVVLKTTEAWKPKKKGKKEVQELPAEA